MTHHFHFTTAAGGSLRASFSSPLPPPDHVRETSDRRDRVRRLRDKMRDSRDVLASSDFAPNTDTDTGESARASAEEAVAPVDTDVAVVESVDDDSALS